MFSYALNGFSEYDRQGLPLFNTEFFFTDRYIIFVVFKSYLYIRRLSA